MRGLPNWPIPDLDVCLKANLEAARLTNPNVFCAGVSVNTSGLDIDTATNILEDISSTLELPCVDPMRDQGSCTFGGISAIVERLC